MCSRFAMPDPRLITDYTPMCIQEENLRNRLGAGTPREYRRMLQDRAIDIIHNETGELKQRTASFRSSFTVPLNQPVSPADFHHRSVG